MTCKNASANPPPRVARALVTAAAVAGRTRQRFEAQVGVRRATLLGSVIAMTFMVSAATATATSQNVASTHGYIKTETAYARAFVTRHSREVAALNQLVKHVAVSCPKVLAGDVGNSGLQQRRTLQEFVTESSLELALAEVAPVRTTITRANRVEERLRWSDPAIHRAIVKNARQERKVLRLKAPDLCVQGRMSAATGFANLPQASVRFLKAAGAALKGDSTRTDPLRLMKRYAPNDVAAATKQIAGLGKRAARLDLQSLPKIERGLLLALFGTTRVAA